MQYALLFQILLLIIILTIGIGLFIWIRRGLGGTFNSENVPDFARYQTRPNYRIFGASPIASYEKLSPSECLKVCDTNPACMSVVYDSKICRTYNTNDDIDPEIIDDIDGINDKTTYYKKYAFWSRFTPQQNGSMMDFSGTAQWSPVNNVKECAIKCLKQTRDPTCRGFNYRPGECQLLSSGLAGNEKYLTGDGNFYGVLDPIISEKNKIPVRTK